MIVLLTIAKAYFLGAAYSALFFVDDCMCDIRDDVPISVAARRYAIAVVAWPLEIAMRPYRRWQEMKRNLGRLT